MSNAPTVAVGEADSIAIHEASDGGFGARSIGSELGAVRTVLSAGAPPMQGPTRSSRLLWIAAAVAMTLTLTLAVVRYVSKSETTAVPSAAPAPAAPAPAAQAFTLFIESVPTGVDVYAGERKIGSTPLQVSVVKDQVRHEASTFTLRRAGYQPYSLVQGYSDENVRLVAALVPEAPGPAPTSVPAPVEAPKAAAPHKPRPSTKPPSPPPASDIRMAR
jgi:serine/threonine-protein kinase